MAGLLITLLSVLVLMYFVALAAQLIRIERELSKLSLLVEQAVKRLQEE